VSRVVVCVETDEVRLQNAFEDFVTNWQDTVDLTAGKWRMKEEANLDVALGFANFLTNHCGHEHQVVVVNPDEIVVLNVLSDCLCEQPVDLFVGIPRGLVEGDLTRVIVQKRPENLI